MTTTHKFSSLLAQVQLQTGGGGRHRPNVKNLPTKKRNFDRCTSDRHSLIYIGAEILDLGIQGLNQNKSSFDPIQSIVKILLLTLSILNLDPDLGIKAKQKWL